MMSENPHSRFGKWSKRGVPHKDWAFIEMEDLGKPGAVCEMCETANVRYVHRMRHDNYPDELRCGRVCAGRMEENRLRAEKREKSFRNDARRRLAWPDRKAWKTSRNGNHQIAVDGHRATVFRKNGGWKSVISDNSTGSKRFSTLTYPDLRTAKLAVYDDVDSAWLK